MGIRISQADMDNLLKSGLVDPESVVQVNADAFGLTEKEVSKIKSEETGESKDFLEASVAFQVKMAGLPEPERNATVEGWISQKNRSFRADFLWREFKLIVEIDGGIFIPGGGGHQRPQAYIKDSYRQCVAVLMGYTYLKVASPFVKSGHCLTWIEKALQNNGYKKDQSADVETPETR